MTSPISCLAAIEEESLSRPSHYKLHRLTQSKLALGSASPVNTAQDSCVSRKSNPHQLPVTTKDHSLFIFHLINSSYRQLVHMGAELLFTGY